MSAAATLLAIDALMGYLEAATKISALISTARAEGREVTMDEFNSLKAESDAKRAEWDRIKDQ